MDMLSIKLSENNGKAPEAVPYMPAGTQEICCTVNGRAGKRVVMVDEAACERLNADLQEHLRASAAGEKARPVILFDHKAGNAAAVPTGFEWDEQRGILLKVDWTAAGREAVEGGNYGYISPAFRLERGSDRISGLQDGVEVGSLVNDPAFQRNECIAAAHAEPEDVQVWAANPYGCNQHGHEWVAEHGEGWRGGEQQEDTLDSIKKRKFSLNQKLQKTRDEMVKLGKLSSTEKDVEKRKEINKKLEELGKTKKKQTEEYQKLAMKETELKDRERQEKAAEKRGYSGKKLDSLLRHYPETVLSARDKEEQEREEELVHAAFDLPPFQDIEKNEKKGDNVEAASVCGGENNQQKNEMETIKKMLGLDADATPADVAAAISALKKQGEAERKRMEEVNAECKEHKKALAEHKERAAEGFIDRLKKGGKVSPQDEETLKAAREMYMENPERTERIYAAMKPICPVADETDEVKAGRVPEGQTFATMSLADCYGSMEF